MAAAAVAAAIVMRPVRTGTHDVAASRQGQRRNHRDRQSEAEYDLAENERPGGVEPDGHDTTASTRTARHWTRAISL